MNVVKFTEFRRNASALLDRVEEGEVFHIERHGRVVAQVAPTAQTRRPPWQRRRAQPQVIPGVSLTQAILDERYSDD